MERARAAAAMKRNWWRQLLNEMKTIGEINPAHWLRQWREWTEWRKTESLMNEVNERQAGWPAQRSKQQTNSFNQIQEKMNLMKVGCWFAEQQEQHNPTFLFNSFHWRWNEKNEEMWLIAAFSTPAIQTNQQTNQWRWIDLWLLIWCCLCVDFIKRYYNSTW